MKQKEKKPCDSRITKRITAHKMFWSNFAVTVFGCTCYLMIFISMKGTMSGWDKFYLYSALATYMVVFSIVTSIAITAIHDRTILYPIQRVCDAAHRVTAGDFQVRLPQRRRRRKNEMDVLYEDFNKMAEELQSIEMLKNDFVSNVSHELKTPVAVIQNYATILESDALTPEERREYAHRIGQASKRLSEMVSSILQLSRLENQKVVANRSRFNLSEQISECVLTFEEELEEKDIDLQVQMDDSILLYSDKNLLRIVWNNLLSNALKFTEAGKALRITAQKEQEAVVVTVADEGCGIAPEQISHIFDKFYQCDTSHATKGNGLGLAMVWQIITLLQGSIAVDSEPGKGTTVTVRLWEKE